MTRPEVMRSTAPRAVLYMQGDDEAVCRAFAEARGFEVASVYRETTNGRGDVQKRPLGGLAIAEVRAALISGPAVLVVPAIACVARSQRALWHLVVGDGGDLFPVASATEPFDTSVEAGRIALGMLGVWARLAPDFGPEPPPAREPKRLGAPPMSELAPEAVKRVVELRREGMSHRAIAERLNTEGVKGGRGGQWWGKTVRAALAQAGVA